MKYLKFFKIALVLSSFIGTMSSAAQFKTLKEKKSSKHYEFEISYPKFFADSVPGYAKINAGLLAAISEGCDAKEAAQGDIDQYYMADARVIALNRRYIGLEVSSGDYCGGAHPNNSVYNLTFDSTTGAKLEIDQEFGFVSYDDPAYDSEKDQARRVEVAKILVDYIPLDLDQDCFAAMTRAEKIDELVSFYAGVEGLAKNKKVVLSISPPHVAGACWFEARVEYAAVKHLISPDSYLHDWLK